MEEELANVVCDTIEKLNVQPSDLVFSSFSRPAIAVLRRRLPHFRCAFLVEAIPDDWECPICGARKASFEPYRQPELLAA